MKKNYVYPASVLVCFNQATLKVRGKALSTDQKAKVVGKTQTGNPLYLKILLEVSTLFATSCIFLISLLERSQ